MARLHQFITGDRPHIDKGSATVYGGPLGVRTIAFALSRVAQNLERLSRGEDVPRPIARVAKGPNRIWSHTETTQLTNSCIAALRRDIAKSRGVLELSYKQRASQWEEMVRLVTEQHLQRGTAQQGGIKHDRGPSATSGVPESIHLLLDMHEALAERSREAIDADHEEEASILIAERQEETWREARELAREQSAEYIDIYGPDPSQGSGENLVFMKVLELEIMVKQEKTDHARQSQTQTVHICTLRQRDLLKVCSICSVNMMSPMLKRSVRYWGHVSRDRAGDRHRINGGSSRGAGH